MDRYWRGRDLYELSLGLEVVAGASFLDFFNLAGPGLQVPVLALFISLASTTSPLLSFSVDPPLQGPLQSGSTPTYPVGIIGQDQPPCHIATTLPHPVGSLTLDCCLLQATAVRGLGEGTEGIPTQKSPGTYCQASPPVTVYQGYPPTTYPQQP